jgi:glutaredoxin 3
MATSLLTRSGIKYEERKIGEGWEKEQLLEAVPGARSVPQIFLYGEYVGGFDKLEKYYEDHNMWSGNAGV